jgi:hypothetical protein
VVACRQVQESAAGQFHIALHSSCCGRLAQRCIQNESLEARLRQGLLVYPDAFHSYRRSPNRRTRSKSRAQVLESYSGATRIYPIVGDPIAQVKSPGRLTGAFEAAGHDAIVVPFQVAPAEIDAFLRALDHARNVDGMLATVPHKFAAYRHASSVSERARLLGGGQRPAALAGRQVACGHARRSGHGAGDRGNRNVFPWAARTLLGAGGAGSAIGLATERRHRAIGYPRYLKHASRRLAEDAR